MPSLALWMQAARPRTLPAAVGPVLVGAALAANDGVFAFAPCLAALVLALALQIAVNFANDYYDAVKGVDTEARLGPTRVTQSGLMRPATVRRGMLAMLAFSLVPGGYLIWLGGWPLFVAGVAAILAAITYSGGPVPYASRALGDVFVFVFFGLTAVCGTYYVQAGHVSALAWLCGSAVGLAITAILAVNNMRDIPTDRLSGKMTLAVILDERGARVYFVVLLAATQALPLLAIAAGLAGWPLAVTLLAAPMAVRVGRGVWRESGRDLNSRLAQTAAFSLLFCLALAAGLLL
jgi:1,4-dihydroxy-2-naphthoate octaprenyltransferase